jgi:hypothetical protein
VVLHRPIECTAETGQVDLLVRMQGHLLNLGITRSQQEAFWVEPWRRQKGLVRDVFKGSYPSVDGVCLLAVLTKQN